LLKSIFNFLWLFLSYIFLINEKLIKTTQRLITDNNNKQSTQNNKNSKNNNDKKKIKCYFCEKPGHKNSEFQAFKATQVNKVEEVGEYEKVLSCKGGNGNQMIRVNDLVNGSKLKLCFD